MQDFVAILAKIALRFCSRFWTPCTAILRDSAESSQNRALPRIASGGDSQAILPRFSTTVLDTVDVYEGISTRPNRVKGFS